MSRLPSMNPKELRRRLIGRVGGVGALVRRREGEVTIVIPSPRVGKRADAVVAGFMLAKIESVEDDYLMCKRWDPVAGEPVGDAFEVSKPWHLRRDYWDGETLCGIEYEWLTNSTRKAIAGEQEWEEELYHPYCTDDIIMIQRTVDLIVDGGGVVVDSFHFSKPSCGLQYAGGGGGADLTELFEVGEKVTLSGFGNASLNGEYTIDSLTPTQMGFTGGCDGWTCDPNCFFQLGTITGEDVLAPWIDTNNWGRQYLGCKPDFADAVCPET